MVPEMLQFPMMLLIQTGFFAVMFMVFPAGKNGLAESLPGALLAAFGWQAFSDLYAVYVEHFAHLSSIYGSVYAIALSMLWLYCCMSILFYGGVLNVLLKTGKNMS
jgi:membrane protein